MKAISPRSFFVVGLAASIWLSSMGAQADDSVRISGFGTVGVVASDTGGASYVLDYLQPPAGGAGRDEDFSFGTDTRLGVQIDWQATPWLSASMQMLSKERSDRSWTPQIEWASLMLRMASDLNLRVGRIRPAIYMLSDYLDISYASHWVRPPIEMYSIALIRRVEGLDLIWKPRFGDIGFTVQPYFGSGNIDLANAIQLEARNFRGLNLVAEHGDVSVRFGHTATRLTLKNSSFDPAVRQLLLNPALIPLSGGTLGLALGGIASLPPATAMLADLAPDDKKTSFTSVGATWDNGAQFVSGEFARRRIDMAVPDTTSWYLTTGLRRGRWTPFVTYARLRVDSAVAYTSSGYTSGLPGADPLVNQVLSELGKEINVANPTAQSTLSLGTRYEVGRGMSLKTQWDIIRTGQSNNGIPQWHGLFAHRTGAFQSASQRVNVFSLTMDFVF